MTDVGGDSAGSLDTYYHNSLVEIRRDVDSKDEEFLLGVDVDELTEFYFQQYALPSIEIDGSRDNIIQKGKSFHDKWQSYIPMTVGIPIILQQNIEEVVSHSASTYLTSFIFKLENGYLIANVQVSGEGQGAESYIQQQLENLKRTIGYKNDNVKRGNEELRRDIKNYIVGVLGKVKKENDIVQSITEKIPIKLVKKQSDAPIVNLKVKKKIQLVMPKSKKQAEAYLEKDQVNAVIDLLINQGRGFETTPAVFSQMEEEQLRDIMLGMLNAIYPGEATGETFVKKGKTDIHLKLPIRGGILTGECKFWKGEKEYQGTIDQHFGYVTWRQNFAIQITFSAKKGFTEVIEKAIEATKRHQTYIKDSHKKMDESYFITEHVFPDDPKKRVEVHHLLFNLFYK